MNLQNKFKEKLSNSHNKREIKKQQRFYENMITSSDENSTSIIFNKTSLAWLIVLVTLLLQLISLATTYKGSIVYFGGINLPFNLSAPLLFALSIQLIVFCVSHTLRSNFRKEFLIVLILATLCSTYFSYIGIYNYINSPLNYLEERYTQINSNISDKYETLRETNKSSITKTMLNLINDLSTSHASLSMEVDNNNKLSGDIANISIDNNIINSQTNSVSKPNINNYGDNLDQYYSDMAKYNAAIGNMITDSTKQDSSLKNELYNAQVNSILGGKSLDEFTAESIDTKSKKEQLEKGVNTSYTLISSEENSLTIDEKLLKIQNYCQNYIQGINGDKDIFTTILLNLNSQILIIKNESSIDNLQTQINEFLILNKKDSDIMKSFSDLKSIVYTNSTGNNYSDNVTLTEENAMELYSLMNSEVKSALYTLNHISSNTEKINSNNEDYIIHNLYVLPVLNLFTLNEEISKEIPKKNKFKIRGTTIDELKEALNFIVKYNEVGDIKGFYVDKAFYIVFCDEVSENVVQYPFDASIEVLAEHAMKVIKNLDKYTLLTLAGHKPENREAVLGWEIFCPTKNNTDPYNDGAFVAVGPKWIKM